MNSDARARERRCYRRPPLSAPYGAAMSAAWLFLAWGSVPPVTAIVFGPALKLGYDMIGEHFIPLLALTSIPVLAVALGCRTGAVWPLFALRITAYLGVLIGFIDLAVSVFLRLGAVGYADKMSRDTGLYGCGCAVVVIGLGVGLILAMRRVRWLDPYSRPEEWETPVNRKARSSMDEYLKNQPR